MPVEYTAEKYTTGGTRAAPSRLPARANRPFLFGFHPSAWEFLPGDGEGPGEFLPRLKRFWIEPGCNGIRADKYGRPDPSNMIAQRMRDGWVFLSDDEPVVYFDEDGDEVREKGYMKRYPARGGYVYCSVWDNPSQLGEGREASIIWGHAFDREGYKRWRRELCERHDWKPGAAMAQRMVHAAERRANRRVTEAHSGNPHIQEFVEGQIDRAEQMKAAAERLHPPRRIKRKRVKAEKVKAEKVAVDA